MNKGVIFDFDGVIINSHNVQMKSLEVAYRSVVGEGKIPYKEFFLLSGDSLENIFMQLNLPLEMVRIYRKYSSEHIGLIKIQENITSVLEYINQAEMKCALCTGKERQRTMDILRYFDLEKYFHFVVCSDDVNEPKPNAESVQIIMEQWGFDIDDCIMIGDGINDIKCAKNAGIKSIAAAWGDVEVEALKVENPYMVAYTSQDLLEYIEQWITLKV